MRGTEMYRVRHWPKGEGTGTDDKDVFRVLLPPSSFLHKISPEELCNIHTAEGITYPAVACPSSDPIIENIIQISKDLQDSYRLRLRDEISISRSNVLIEDANEVSLCEISPDKSEITLDSLDQIGRSHWAWKLEYKLRLTKKIVPGMLWKMNENGEKRIFKILYINSSESLVLYNSRTVRDVKVVDDIAQPRIGDEKTLVIPGFEIGGLDRQLQQLNEILALYSVKNYRLEMPSFYQPCQCGIILYGAPGTGKSLVLQKIREAGWRKVYHIDGSVIGQRASDSETAIKEIFSNALRFQPSVIIVDCLDTIASKSTFAGQLLSRELERLNNNLSIAIGATRSLSDIDQDLRSAGRFETEIEIPIPDSNCRAEILKVLCGLPKDSSQKTLDDIAARTHGFVGGDLRKLLGNAVRTNEIRRSGSRSIDGDSNGACIKPERLLDDMKDDFEQALLKVRPTAMQEIFVEVPKVKWSEIGGQDELKSRLEQAVVWPVKYSNEMRTFGLTPKQGLLLYGPPGCSKTMTAKAAATESGLNFIAVRGAELLSMYVGESERAIREVFSKARAARPCIIFFDEFDAIGASRDSSHQGGIHTVTTLLNEIDGFEELKGVFVLAATNKPEVIDPALLRAGRLSETLYVGLPDLDARKAILDMQTGSTNLADDVDKTALSNMTGGYSGAEIVAICQQANYAAFEEQIRSGKPQNICQRHFNIAMAKVEKSVTLEMTRRYEAWGARRH